ncbi:MAG: hypothetical protein HY077_19190 [Elusimicrobia bacterium]|nr:hypothetical protein [Elusimicrobiota bacterium]
MRTKKTTLKQIILLALGLIASGPFDGRAAGLRTQFGEVVLRRLKIGQTYSMQKFLNLPYRVVNTGDEPVTLKVDIISIATDQLKEGYEPLPDLSWVKLDTREFPVLDPNHEAVSDVTISIPNDSTVMGRRFQANIWSHTQSPKGIVAVGMLSRLLIQVDSTPPSEEDKKFKPSEHRAANMDFTLYPSVGRAEDVPLGIDYDLKKAQKISVKLINPNDEKMRFRIQSLPNWEANLERPKGFVDAYNPKWLRAASTEVEVEGNSLKEVPLIVNIPDESQHYHRNFFFAVAVDVAGQEIAARVFYKLMVTTVAAPPPQPAPKKDEKTK